MPGSFQIPITSNAAEIAAKLGTFPSKMGAAIVRVLNEENELTVADIAQNKLSQRGPKTLGVVDNRLRPSVRKSDAVVSGAETISGIGSNVGYLAPHEFGFKGTVRVKAHKRRIIAYDRYRQTRGGNFVKTQSGIPGVIRAHSMQMNLPERAPIRSTIAERAPRYTEAISAGILAAWGGAA